MRYITIKYREDKRVTIGTAIHKDIKCPKINKLTARLVTGEILNFIPKCRVCFGKKK